ncbi:IPP transferase-domain-containing protein [Zychaea mexicana]|uniref:IPP transferase-domain-containing protein n=1 Tax=Zychaea mexicana TaxID=64656 RepID=UPI0022FDDEC3|nr:IPP transferase-domain-containing protein [Zychaea mexicana]KAI9488698.1 IPP transferase-domain-containing protein [Zychaea mexicana]
MRRVATIIGTTGVGKSQLGVELCKALRGQVINADSMQVYKGLDVITNKMPIHERQGVQHHLMDFLDPEDEYKVTEFKRDATECIEKLSLEQNFPVIVGGTNYYIQSLLWHNMLIKERNEEEQEQRQASSELEALSTADLHAQLQKVDPVMANRWHPSDRRKILRSLQIYHQTGRPQSDIIKEQQEQHDAHGMQARFKSLIFWLYADPMKLNPRLDDRVDKMIETGLFDEIKSLRKRVVDGSVQLPGQDLEKYQRGLWQAIGYKEFDPYFSAIEANDKSDQDLDKIRIECTERMKSATRRYAKRQVQWIRNKLLSIVNKSKDVDIFLLDATDLDAWDTNVRQNAIDIATAFQEDKPLPDATSLGSLATSMLAPLSSSSPSTLDSQTRALTWQKHTCTICRTSNGEPLILYGDLEWKQHFSSRSHRKTLKRRANDAERAKRMKLTENEDTTTADQSSSPPPPPPLSP